MFQSGRFGTLEKLVKDKAERILKRQDNLRTLFMKNRDDFSTIFLNHSENLIEKATDIIDG